LAFIHPDDRETFVQTRDRWTARRPEASSPSPRWPHRPAPRPAPSSRW
jgi:hypothetical protein